ncbi:tol-pal system YbgF family protein [Fibrobacterota bacterium]
MRTGLLFLCSIVFLLNHGICRAEINDSPEISRINRLCRDSSSREKCLLSCYQLITKEPESSITPSDSAIIFPREIFLHYFEKSQRPHTARKEVEVRLPAWLRIYRRFLQSYPQDELIPSLQLNLAAEYTNLGLLDSALKTYREVISQFDGRTRFGAEALFYSGQIHYVNEQYAEALQAYERIRSTVFLPIGRDGLTIRMAECRFRSMEQDLAQKDTSRALDRIEIILNQPLPPLFRDSVLFHRAEIETRRGNIHQACRTLEEIIKTDNHHGIYFHALYNQLLYSCPLSETKHDSCPLFESRSREFLVSDNPPEQKLIVHELLLDHILEFQDVKGLRSYFSHSFLRTIDAGALTGALLHLLRNAVEKSFQKALLEFLMVGNTNEKCGNLCKAISGLHGEVQLYKQYYTYLSGQNLSLPADTSYAHPWENSLYVFLKGVFYIQQYAQDQDNRGDFIDSVLINLTQVGKLNSELAFASAEELITFYGHLGNQPVASEKPDFKKLGLLLVNLRYTIKAENLVIKTRAWRKELNATALHPETEKLYKRIQSRLEPLKKNILNYWKMVSVLFSEMEAPPGESRTEVAFELLMDKIRSIILEHDRRTRESSVAAISAALAWYHLKVQSGPDSDSLLDHQARAAQYVLWLLSQEEINSDSLFLLKIGESFKKSFLPKDWNTCYAMPDTSGRMLCFPMVQQMPSVRKFLKTMEAPSRIEPRKRHLYYKNQENLAYFFMLCENHKIRELKTILRQF